MHNILIITKVKSLEEAAYYLKEAHENSLSRNVLLNFIKADSYKNAKIFPKYSNFARTLPEHLQEQANEILKSTYNLEMLGLKQPLRVQTGDEVICQSFTFAASANPIVYLGAKPVFVDSETDTWNMNPFLLEEAIQDRLRKTGHLPKAIVAVHLYGMPAKIDKILLVAAKYEIPVVEDAAEALGSTFNRRKCGAFREFGILSFNGNKIITTSGGGALVCRTEEQAKKTMFYATQARDPAPHYQHSHIGYNYRMSNICAGIGRGQMMVLNDKKFNGIVAAAIGVVYDF